MKSILVGIGLALLCLASASAVLAGQQELDCDTLLNGTPSDLVNFLNSVAPGKANETCVTRVIRKLGNKRYEPAIPTLIKSLDFRRPLTEQERRGFLLRPQGPWEMYPAVSALSSMGEVVLPAVLEAIRSSSASDIAQENAVDVWMEIYRQKGNQPEGVALLKQNEISAASAAIKQRLARAIQEAVNWCGQAEKKLCKDAARVGSFGDAH